MIENQTHEAPQTTATVGVPTVPHSIVDTGISLRDLGIVGGIIVAIIVVLTFLRSSAASKRAEDQKDAHERTTLIMDALKVSGDTAARDVRELSDKVKDGRTVLEKDIESIRQVVRHDIASVKTQIQSAHHFGEKNADEITKLRDRMTQQETNSKHQNDALNKLESTVREKIDEMKELIKAQGETTTTQFRELSNSIREARDAKFKA